MQLVEIARALAGDCRVLILDEPTAALTQAEVTRLFEVLQGLRSRGVALVYISHKLEEVFALADRITVLRDGRQVGSAPASRWTRDQVIARMVGRELTGRFPSRRRVSGPPLLEVRNLSVPGKLFDINLTLRQGEILGLFGLMGAGQALLARALFGAVPGTRGEVLLEGRPLRLSSPQEAIGHHIALVTEDRKHEGLILIDHVVGNTTLAALRQFTRAGFLRGRRQREVTASFVDRLRIRTLTLDQEVGYLSGGNQQKVVLAKWLATDPRILILVEPTRGVDVGAKAEIYQIMDELVGIPGTSAARDRGQGFNDVAGQAAGIRVVARQEAGFDRAQGLTVMENILQAQPKIDAVFAHNDEMALGALTAIEAAGRQGEMIVVGFDATADAVQAVKDGRMAATVAQQPILMGELSVQAAIAYLNGQAVDEFIPVPLMLVTD